MKPADLDGLSRPEDPAVRPDGGAVAFVRSTIEMEGDRYHRSIWLTEGEEAPRRFTAGPSDSAPAWSPDGSRLAFMRAVDDVPQVAVMPTDGGEATVITSFPLGVRSLAWSPDGSSIAVVGVDWIDEWGDLDEDERTRAPRRITRLPYRFDAKGWTHDRRAHVYVIDPDGGDGPRCLTPGDSDEASPTWHPDGDRIAFLSDRRDDRSQDLGAQVYVVDVGSGDTTQLLEHGGWLLAEYSPSGDLHLLGRPDVEWPRVAGLWRLEDDGSLTALTQHLDRSAATLSAGTPFIRFDGGIAHTQHEDAGSTGVVGVHADGTVDHVVAGRRVVSGFSVASGTMAYVASEPTDPGTLFLSTGDEERSLAGSSELSLVEPDHFTTVSDGVEIDVWVLLPPGDEKVPLLLNIHGGPASQYGFGFFDEFQIYAAAGYGVVACNPRGSSGRGEEFVKAVAIEGWGRVDVADVTAAVDAALERHSRLDPDRMGIMGGSYGGFLTAWIIADDHRWDSAVVERGLLSFNSFAGTSDIGGSFPLYYTGAGFGDGWETWWEKSPLRIAHETTTPTLVLHAENDFRCPIEQAEQYFATLLKTGVETELLRFPGEGHEMSRSGKPRHRKERFDAILDWHARHLGG